MPTKKRISVPGALVHIMARGISGINIFKDTSDKKLFLNLLSTSLKESQYLCYAWALMDNHYHLLLRCSEQPLDKLMRNLHSKYAKSFNCRHSRRGYLFQDRFKSIITQDQNYAEELVRYVHLNPVRAGICTTLRKLETYKWCGHATLLGTRKCAFQTTKAVLSRFGKSPAVARNNYRSFIEQGLSTQDDNWLQDKVRESNRGTESQNRPECWVIGDRDFVSSVMQKHSERLHIKRNVAMGIHIDDVCLHLATQNGITTADILKRSRNSLGAITKKKLAYICAAILDFPITQIADYLNISGPAVSYLVREGGRFATEKDYSYFINL